MMWLLFKVGTLVTYIDIKKIIISDNDDETPAVNTQ